MSICEVIDRRNEVVGRCVKELRACIDEGDEYLDRARQEWEGKWTAPRIQVAEDTGRLLGRWEVMLALLEGKGLELM